MARELDHFVDLCLRGIWAFLFDEEKARPCLVPPLGLPLPVPLRVTREEWTQLCLSSGPYPLFIHPLFTLVTAVVPCQGRTDYDRRIRIVCPRGTPKSVVFGPYDHGKNRAIACAQEYLGKAGVLEIIEETNN